MKLSIITVNYNNIAGLEKTTRSIAAQTWNDCEWIIIDGGSNDGSKEFLQSHDKEIAFWCSEPDSGIYNAMNKGIKVAQGDYLLFLNSGDTLYADDVLEKALPHLDGTDIVYGDAMFLYKKRPKRWVYDEVMTMKKMYECSVNHQSTFIRTELLKQEGYDESYKIVADWKRFTEWLKEGKSFRHIDMIVANYDTGGISTMNQEATIAERDRFFREMYPEEVVDVFRDWVTFQNKPCLQTRKYCNANRFFRRLIRSNLHMISWLDKL